MTNQKVKVGIVGLGHNGMAHARTHAAVGKSEIVALCDFNQERLEAAGREFGVDALYADESFHEHPGMEAVSVHTGDYQHKDPFVKAVRGGKHVLVEKPLANSEEDVREMVAAVDEAAPGLKVQVGYVLRFNPVFERIRALAGDGSLGDVFYMEADYIHNLLYQVGQVDAVMGGNWYLDHEYPLVGGGSHALDLLRWISGKQVVGAQALGNHRGSPEMRHDDCQVGLFRFEDGTIAKIAALYAPRMAMAPYYNLRVYGTGGTVERDQVALSSGPEDVHPEFAPVEAERTGGHPFEPEVEDWLDSILEDRPPRTPLHDGANSTMATLCAVRAAAEGRPVEVPVFAPSGTK